LIKEQSIKEQNIRELNIDTWKRKAQFDFFLDYDDPTFNVTANVDVTNLRTYAKKHELSFFLASLFVSTKVCNLVDEFRYRIRDGKVFIHDRIDAGSTVLMDDNTFTFAYFDYVDDIHEFCKTGAAIVENCKRKGGLETRDGDDSLIFYSVLPWVSFTSLKNPSKTGKNVSIPKIVLGKYFESLQVTSVGTSSNSPIVVSSNLPIVDSSNSSARGSAVRLLMPISVEAHHSLMDGFHVGQYFQIFQSIVDSLGNH